MSKWACLRLVPLHSSALCGANCSPTCSTPSQVKLLAQLNHPYVLGYIESFTHKNHLCIITEFCEGGDLYTRLKVPTAFLSLRALPARPHHLPLRPLHSGHRRICAPGRGAGSPLRLPGPQPQRMSRRGPRVRPLPPRPTDRIYLISWIPPDFPRLRPLVCD